MKDYYLICEEDMSHGSDVINRNCIDLDPILFKNKKDALEHMKREAKRFLDFMETRNGSDDILKSVNELIDLGNTIIIISIYPKYVETYGVHVRIYSIKNVWR